MIAKQAVLLDPFKLSLGVTVFVSIRTNQHSHAWFEKFYATVREIPYLVQHGYVPLAVRRGRIALPSNSDWRTNLQR